ncbi:N-acetylmuramoyl-L-alanine amidase [Bacteroides faecichinchillae]|uniref:N-acetylmuramoyl-L-alanine amidase n=1 Tax=Bacteroides faecichinchillae TaxID=871325 RepID=A0A1M4VID3_9BACE|nr:N-acetylmuramoyl-L-alanine amidase [Bacteroides faecichinchillae]
MTNIMRKIDSIIIHCSATKAGQDFTVMDIDGWHRKRGFNGIGYHYVIRLDGKVEKGRDISLVGAHCKGWNERSIGVCYIGGLDKNGCPADTRTNEQKHTLYQLVIDLKNKYDIHQVLGHRDTSPDLDGDGVVESCEYIKSCPCFDVKSWLGRKNSIK